MAIRYNTKLHRYEFTSLIWDVANREFVRDASGRFEQEYLFYQPRNIERTVIDTRAGDDEVHADPGFRFPARDRMGHRAGDREQGAHLGARHPRWGVTTRCWRQSDDIIDGAPGWISSSVEQQ